MCGIVGIAGPHDPAWVDAMNGIQAHRGPDDRGLFSDPDVRVSLGVRRLAIVDVEGGRQPMEDPLRRLVVVCNGEIFNAPLLRRELEAEGCTFRSAHSDTETLLHLYARYGPEMLHRLNGMFAFVIYDRAARTLFGARDHAGIKPFYYCSSAGRFAFASELKSLLQLPFISRTLDRTSAHHYLSLQFVPPPRTIFAGLRKLPAGHSFRYDVGSNELRIERYWRPPAPDSGLGRRTAATRSEVQVEIRRAADEAVRDWLMSDVPVGCALSGGLDSSVVVAILARAGVRPIRTWTLGFARSYSSATDERAVAAAVARRWNTDHQEIVIEEKSLLADLERMVWHLDEPYAGGLPSWAVFRAMAGRVKVVMTGTGGDELFGNYGKWRAMTPGSRAWLRRLVGRVIRDRSAAEALRHPQGFMAHGYFLEGEKRRIWSGGWSPEESTPGLLQRLWNETGCADPRDAVQRLDFQLQLPEEFLLMTDRFSMAWSLEARTPFLDRRLVELVCRLPADDRTDASDPKRLWREAMHGYLPEEVRRAPKRGFVLPLAEWLRGDLRPLVDDLLDPAGLRRQGLFRPSVHAQYVRPHLLGLRDYSSQIWTLLMFQLWWRVHMEGRERWSRVCASST